MIGGEPAPGGPRIAVYPGSFDPLHEGHLDIMRRCRPLFDEVVVAVLHNEAKAPLFSVEERVGMLADILAGEPSFLAEGVTALSTAAYRLERRDGTCAPP